MTHWRMKCIRNKTELSSLWDVIMMHYNVLRCLMWNMIYCFGDTLHVKRQEPLWVKDDCVGLNVYSVPCNVTCNKNTRYLMMQSPRLDSSAPASVSLSVVNSKKWFYLHITKDSRKIWTFSRNPIKIISIEIYM